MHYAPAIVVPILQEYSLLSRGGGHSDVQNEIF